MRRGSQHTAWGATVALLLTAAAAAQADTFLVNTGGDDPLDPQPGSLRAAIRDAQPGDTIEFVQSLTVRLESGFRIFEGQDDVTIRGPVTIDGTAARGAVVSVGSNDVTFEDLTLRDVSVNAGRAFPSTPLTGLTITGCDVGEMSDMQLSGLDDSQVVDCTFTGPAAAKKSSKLSIGLSNGVTISGCTFDDEGKVTVGDAEELTFHDNRLGRADATFMAVSGTISDNVFGDDRVIVLHPDIVGTPGELVISGNTAPSMLVERLWVTVKDNTFGRTPAQAAGARDPFGPLQVLGADKRAKKSPSVAGPVEVSGNTIDGGRTGLVVRHAAPVEVAYTVSGNTVRDAARNGIEVLDMEEVTVSGNTVEDVRPGNGKQSSVGLLLADLGALVTLQGNAVRRVEGTGIRLDTVGDAELFGDEVEDCTRSGIETKGRPGSLLVVDVAVRGSGRDGIAVGKRWRFTGDDVTVENSGRDGIIVGKQARCTMAVGTLTGNGRDGVRFGKKSSGLVLSSTFTGNGGAGVYVDKKSEAAVAAESFSGNLGEPIDLSPTGATANRNRKKANGDLDFPELEYDAEQRRIVGTTEPGATVRIYAVDGKDTTFFAETLATQDGAVVYPDDEPLECQNGDTFRATATRIDGRTTSELSDPIVCEVPVIPILRASQDDAGVGGDEESTIEAGVRPPSRAISDDGSRIVFSSQATNLVDGDTNGERDAFLHDVATRTTRRISLLPGGGQLGNSTNLSAGNNPIISGDGKVAFYNTESGTWRDAVGVFAYTNIIRVDLETGAAAPVGNLIEEGGPKLGGGGFELSTNTDGSLLAFVHNSTRYYTDADTNRSDDVYLWLGDDTYEWISRTHDDMAGDDGGSGVFAACRGTHLSSDGNVVSFACLLEGLVPGGPAGGVPYVYARDRGAGTIALVSRAPDGSPVITDDHALSASGRFVVFATRQSLVPEDTDDDFDVYLRDLQEGTTVFASPNPEGKTFDLQARRATVSADGNLVAFEMGSSGFNQPQEVWLHDRDAGTLTRLSGGFDGAALSQGELPGITPDGSYVVFQSFQPDLLPDDADQNFEQDVFRRSLVGPDE